MANDAREPGKPRTRNPGLEWFSKWTGYVCAGALLLGVLVFETPWKITLFLAYLFASSVELIPGSITRSRWVRWPLIGVLCILWPVWLFLPSHPGDYKPFRFVEERAQLEQEYSIPDDQNASSVYMRLLEESEPNARALPSWIGKSDKAVLRRPWKSEEYPEIARWLDERQGTIEALKNLGPYSQCRFPMEPALQALESSDPRRGAVRTWAHALTMMANRKAGEGDTAGALQLYALTLKIADHHIQQSDVSDYLVGLAVERMAFNAIGGIAVEGTPAPDELAAMDALTATPSHEWASTWQRIVGFECLSAKNALCGILYEVNTEGKIRYSRRGFAALKGTKTPDQERFGGKLFASAMWVLLPRSPWKFARRIDERCARFSRIGQPGTEPPSPGTIPRARFRANHEYFLDLLLDMVEPACHETFESHLKNVATRRACRILLLLRQYRNEAGRWPASPPEIGGKDGPELWTDPLNGSPFMYQLDGQAFRLYSTGLNGIDEDGAGGDDLSFRPARTQNKERGHASPEPE